MITTGSRTAWPFLLLLSIFGVMAAGQAFGDTYTATGAADFKDGFLYQASSADNWGGDTRILIGRGGTGQTFHEYLWFNIPGGINTNVVCTLAVYLSLPPDNTDTFDIFWCTRPNAPDYVGNNVGSTADSAEMDWVRFFNNGTSPTPPDTSWTTAGGDVATADTLGRRIISGGLGAGWYYWVLDSVQVDSLLKGTRANSGVFINGHATGTATRGEGASTENSNSALRPWVKFVYTTEAGAPTENFRRRQMIIQP